MRLLRLGATGDERPAVLPDEGPPLDASGIVADLGGAGLADQIEAVRAAVERGSLPLVPDPDARVGPPVTGIGKIVCQVFGQARA